MIEKSHQSLVPLTLFLHSFFIIFTSFSKLIHHSCLRLVSIMLCLCAPHLLVTHVSCPKGWLALCFACVLLICSQPFYIKILLNPSTRLNNILSAEIWLVEICCKQAYNGPFIALNLQKYCVQLFIRIGCGPTGHKAEVGSPRVYHLQILMTVYFGNGYDRTCQTHLGLTLIHNSKTPAILPKCSSLMTKPYFNLSLTQSPPPRSALWPECSCNRSLTRRHGNKRTKGLDRLKYQLAVDIFLANAPNLTNYLFSPQPSARYNDIDQKVHSEKKKRKCWFSNISAVGMGMEGRGTYRKNRQWKWKKKKGYPLPTRTACSSQAQVATLLASPSFEGCRCTLSDGHFAPSLQWGGAGDFNLKQLVCELIICEPPYFPHILLPEFIEAFFTLDPFDFMFFFYFLQNDLPACLLVSTLKLTTSSHRYRRTWMWQFLPCLRQFRVVTWRMVEVF
ncbi:hypothetical protein VP01_760g4 [Puccinia sorghi]|uniref:Uncharacterized protein n=1 Tax=Puccinia sorghi TaxID=27349 RepID=A0A0L6UBZ3_9BASI|nr:hypothetical protein VP01_760g4 [Puccinia sorghi]